MWKCKTSWRLTSLTIDIYDNALCLVVLPQTEPGNNQGIANSFKAAIYLSKELTYFRVVWDNKLFICLKLLQKHSNLFSDMEQQKIQNIDKIYVKAWLELFLSCAVFFIYMSLNWRKITFIKLKAAYLFLHQANLKRDHHLFDSYGKS